MLASWHHGVLDGARRPEMQPASPIRELYTTCMCPLSLNCPQLCLYNSSRRRAAPAVAQQMAAIFRTQRARSTEFELQEDGVHLIATVDCENGERVQPPPCTCGCTCFWRQWQVAAVWTCSHRTVAGMPA